MVEKVIVVEDEVSLQETLAYNLKKQGYEVQVVGDGLKALETIRSWNPDLIILDVMLPGMDGFEITRTLRQEISTPILMLTAKDEEIDRVVGLEIGADDYLTKPFSMRELMARVKAMLRRVRLIREETKKEFSQEEKPVLKFDNLFLDLNRREIRLDDSVLQSKPKEYELLLFLAQHHGQALSRDFILERVWGWDYVGDSRTVDVHVRWLREKIETDPSHPQRIVTVRGSGYRFEG
jgi:DNA-binding response OmpR family regulator